MNSSRLITCLSMIFVFGCASTETVKEAQVKDATRVYAAPYATVFEATAAAAKRNDLQLYVVENDKAAGRVVLSHGITWQSLGEISFKSSTPTSTQVGIVNTGAMAHLIDLPEWQTMLLDEIEQELQRKK